MASHALPSALFAPPPNNPLYSRASAKKRFVRSVFSLKDGSSSGNRCGFHGVRAFFPNPDQEPILKEALQEPVAFMGGVVAGLLRLDLNEDPLKEWITRTVEASGIISGEEGDEEEGPQQIQIE